MSALDDVYGIRDGRRVLAMSILGLVNPATVNQMGNVMYNTIWGRIGLRTTTGSDLLNT